MKITRQKKKKQQRGGDLPLGGIGQGSWILDNAGEAEEQWSTDMSQLFIGCKFASGRHSRIYRGMYKHVAIKLISQPEEDEDMAAFGQEAVHLGGCVVVPIAAY
ncbi:hypothetical protein MLD38_032726 [Melastoma candidum]|uniref:Uncharacterized protein n=1 Tax=Melastoma candidum TaxID=119954 RepID=A0ACB9M866_9MYRT|nr:hypothetical protein MLD38_032726 [Melastoma candidum]